MTVDLGALSTPFDRIGTGEAAAIARACYGLDGRLHRLDTEKDDTFRLDTPEGRFILKIANPGEGVGELDLQVSALRHLQARAPDLPVPRVLPDLAGDYLPVVAGNRRARLMTFLPGAVMDTVTPLPEERRQIGRLLARLRHALADFRHPEACRTLVWDVRHLPSLVPLLNYVPPRHKTALAEGILRFAELMPRIDALPRQILHNDFSRSNLLVARPGGVTGIIDFGDVVETAIAVDVSTALLNQLPRDAAARPVNDLFAEARDVLTGYQEIARLSREELSLIPHLVMGRIVTRALLSLWRAASFPDNAAYILRNTEQGWAQLDWFLARDPAAVSELLL
ncbi:phosphotransferase [Paenirhodobacter sp.]|uniref:phosphotransferase n=1 Tax=Paenirhodobacter sp. TaxID=1965326 RepID=UPI003B423A24